jgi:hypothetical protein
MDQVYDLEIIDAADWLDNVPPEPDQVLAELLDAGDKMAVVGSSKMRKSFFFQQMGMSIAVGRDFLDIRVPKRRKVLYVQFEIRKPHSHRRTRCLARAMGISASELRGQFKTIPARGKGLKGAEGLEWIKHKSADFQPEVIMLDPLYKLAEGVENAAEDLKVILNAFDELAEQTGAAIIYVHHDSKGAPGDKDIRDRGAGSNVLSRDYDVVITLTPHAAEPNAVVVESLVRNYPPKEPFTIVWDCTEGGYCFVMADDLPPDKKTSKSKPTPPPIASYLPVAKSILSAKGQIEIGYFKTLLKEETKLSNHRLNDFMRFATGGQNPPILTKEERGKGLHKKWVCTQTT